MGQRRCFRGFFFFLSFSSVQAPFFFFNPPPLTCPNQRQRREFLPHSISACQIARPVDPQRCPYATIVHPTLETAHAAPQTHIDGRVSGTRLCSHDNATNKRNYNVGQDALLCLACLNGVVRIDSKNAPDGPVAVQCLADSRR
ncbi:hypothetical protein T01_430 [Trichinella spiralis]|uniref:Uncharacterized protein n=1 Tax=Trichinella spiralis TaxID=6334 RepID=A0A0V1B0F7_TRISP|nr:hypothetical protein T01_430 [Trichinella spiralis]